MRPLLIFAILVVGVAQARDLPAPIHQSGTLPSGTKYELSIEEGTYSHPSPSQKDSEDGSFWGVDGGFPESIITKFEFRLNGKDVYIPRKVSANFPHLQVGAGV